jgi:hypothetical protein
MLDPATNAYWRTNVPVSGLEKIRQRMTAAIDVDDNQP